VVQVKQKESEADKPDEEEDNLESDFLLSLKLLRSQLVWESRHDLGLGGGIDNWGDDSGFLVIILSLRGGVVLGHLSLWLVIIRHFRVLNRHIFSVDSVFQKWLSGGIDCYT
jgi:hypothetical protein